MTYRGCLWYGGEDAFWILSLAVACLKFCRFEGCVKVARMMLGTVVHVQNTQTTRAANPGASPKSWTPITTTSSPRFRYHQRIRLQRKMATNQITAQKQQRKSSALNKHMHHSC